MRETQISKTESTLENMYTQWENIPAVYNFLNFNLSQVFFLFWMQTQVAHRSIQRSTEK